MSRMQKCFVIVWVKFALKFEFSDGKNLVKFERKTFLSARTALENLGGISAQVSEKFGSFVSKFASFSGNFVQQKGNAKESLRLSLALLEMYNDDQSTTSKSYQRRSSVVMGPSSLRAKSPNN